MKGLDELRSKFDELIGVPCWGAACGVGTGSRLELLLGAQIERDRPVRNSHLSHDVRNFEGEFGLFVECAWRVERANSIIVGGSSDSNEEDGPMGGRLPPGSLFVWSERSSYGEQDSAR